ncbi:MAG: tRNA (cytidine(34)-2'-O)-methyltransferase [Betaproteobacteria bacterium]|nr:tRNA (cytidine(34)-2'-O)-methyltransferase [Betaproteobacteria bacterium]
MFHVVLFEPEIPPNTGNVIRLAANTGAALHLVHPLGFTWDDARVRRAGLDYHELANVRHHDGWAACRAALGTARLIAVETDQATRYDQLSYRPGDAFIFGKETTGLPGEVLDAIPVEYRVFLPMRPGNRSLNLSNSVAVVVYEAWRQAGFRT